MSSSVSGRYSIEESPARDLSVSGRYSIEDLLVGDRVVSEYTKGFTWIDTELKLFIGVGHSSHVKL